VSLAIKHHIIIILADFDIYYYKLVYFLNRAFQKYPAQRDTGREWIIFFKGSITNEEILFDIDVKTNKLVNIEIILKNILRL